MSADAGGPTNPSTSGEPATINSKRSTTSGKNLFARILHSTISDNERKFGPAEPIAPLAPAAERVYNSPKSHRSRPGRNGGGGCEIGSKSGGGEAQRDEGAETVQGRSRNDRGRGGGVNANGKAGKTGGRGEEKGSDSGRSGGGGGQGRGDGNKKEGNLKGRGRRRRSGAASQKLSPINSPKNGGTLDNPDETFEETKTREQFSQEKIIEVGTEKELEVCAKVGTDERSTTSGLEVPQSEEACRSFAAGHKVEDKSLYLPLDVTEDSGVKYDVDMNVKSVEVIDTKYDAVMTVKSVEVLDPETVQNDESDRKNVVFESMDSIEDKYSEGGDKASTGVAMTADLKKVELPEITVTIADTEAAPELSTLETSSPPSSTAATTSTAQRSKSSYGLFGLIKSLATTLVTSVQSLLNDWSTWSYTSPPTCPEYIPFEPNLPTQTTDVDEHLEEAEGSIFSRVLRFASFVGGVCGGVAVAGVGAGLTVGALGCGMVVAPVFIGWMWFTRSIPFL
ncbi:hypothetical protein HDU67_007325 [Dinochytrium kinnereticum]|nr:hypothetical protein HDU67_007325 [Dinochytrium kinnereticum]